MIVDGPNGDKVWGQTRDDEIKLLAFLAKPNGDGSRPRNERLEEFREDLIRDALESGVPAKRVRRQTELSEKEVRMRKRRANRRRNASG